MTAAAVQVANPAITVWVTWIFWLEETWRAEGATSAGVWMGLWARYRGCAMMKVLSFFMETFLTDQNHMCINSRFPSFLDQPGPTVVPYMTTFSRNLASIHSGQTESRDRVAKNIPCVKDFIVKVAAVCFRLTRIAQCAMSEVSSNIDYILHIQFGK